MCAVHVTIIFYADDKMETEHYFVGGQCDKVVTILQQPGVINWNVKNRILKGIIEFELALLLIALYRISKERS